MREEFAPQKWTVGVPELKDARRRWMRAGYSAIARCVEAEDVGMRGFLGYADTTQRELVGRTAKEFYVKELGLTGDGLAEFFGATNVGVVGSGFDYEMPRYEPRDDSVSADQYRCPLIDHLHAAGYDTGDPVLKDWSLWCDTYDNFESAATAPSVAMAHSHCLGLGDRTCRWYIETIPSEKQRRPGEHLYDYLARMRDEYRAKGDGPWAQDGLDPAEIDRMTREWVGDAEADQDKLYPTEVDKYGQGVLVSSRIGSSSILIAGELLGWDRLIDGMARKEGPILTKAARAKADERGIYGFTAITARYLHQALTLGTLFGPYAIEEESADRVVGSCATCPIIEAGVESELGEACKNVMPYCTTAATWEAKAIASDLIHTYTHCLGRGDGICRWVIERS